jgi:hypothetical protein
MEVHADGIATAPSKQAPGLRPGPRRRYRGAAGKVYRKSKVTNGRALFTEPFDSNSAAGRRFKDILASIVSDLGGIDRLSEGERQLARRAAALSYSCESLECRIIGGPPGDAAWREHTGGLSPYEILAESSRILHAVARSKGGGTAASIAAFTALPNAEMDHVASLLVKAGDLAAKSLNGSDRVQELELLGTLSARLTRIFQQLGLKRQAREVLPLHQRWEITAEANPTPSDDERAGSVLMAAEAASEIQIPDGGGSES